MRQRFRELEEDLYSGLNRVYMTFVIVEQITVAVIVAQAYVCVHAAPW